MSDSIHIVARALPGNRLLVFARVALKLRSIWCGEGLSGRRLSPTRTLYLLPSPSTYYPLSGIPLSDEEFPKWLKCACKRGGKKVRARLQPPALAKSQVAPSQTIARPYVSCDYQHTKRKAIVIPVANTCKGPFVLTASSPTLVCQAAIPRQASLVPAVALCEGVAHQALLTRQVLSVTTVPSSPTLVCQAAIPRQASLVPAVALCEGVAHQAHLTRQVPPVSNVSVSIIPVHQAAISRQVSFAPTVSFCQVAHQARKERQVPLVTTISPSRALGTGAQLQCFWKWAPKSVRVGPPSVSSLVRNLRSGTSTYGAARHGEQWPTSRASHGAGKCGKYPEQWLFLLPGA